MRIACVGLLILLPGISGLVWAGGSPNRARPSNAPSAVTSLPGGGSGGALNTTSSPTTEPAAQGKLEKSSTEDIKAAKEAMKAFIDGLIRGDDKQVMEQLAITDADKPVAQGMFGLICATQRLRQAALDAHIDLSGIDLGATEDDAKRLLLAVAASVPTLEGDSAKMVLNDDTYELKRVAGVWKLDFEGTQKHMGDMPPASVAEQSKKKMAAYDALAADIKNGKVKSIQEIKESLAGIEKETK